MSQGDNSLDRQDEQGRKGKEKLYRWRAETWVMKGIGQSQKEKSAGAREMIPRPCQPNPVPSHRSHFSTRKYCVNFSPEKDNSRCGTCEAGFPIFCQEMTWSGDQWKRCDYGCSSLGMCSTRRKVFQLLSNGLLRHCSCVITGFSLVCKQLFITLMKWIENGTVTKNLISWSPVYEKLAKSLLTKWLYIMTKRTWKVTYFSVTMDLNSLLHVSAARCKAIIKWKSSQKHN